MSTTEAQIKRLLKKAKLYLTEHEFEYCIDEIKDVLALDDQNYLAYIFNGKAYHSLDQIDKAIEAYEKAIKIDKSNLLAWKGLYMVYKNSDDYNKFFSFTQRYVEVLIEKQEPLHELVKDINVYNKKFNPKNLDLNLYASFLRAILPDTNLGRAVGPQLNSYEKTMEELLKIVTPAELKKVKEVKRRYPVNATIAQQQLMNKELYQVYSKSEIPSLYTLIINSTKDDEVRYHYEDLQLKYTFDMIPTIPDEDEKRHTLAKFIDDVQGMVTIRHPSQTAWYFYFDLVCSNLESLDQLDLDELCWYVSKFSSDQGLAKIIYAFLWSDISPFSVKAVLEKLNEHLYKAESQTHNEVSEESDELQELEDNDEIDGAELGNDSKQTSKHEQYLLSSDDIITYLSNGSDLCKNSLFGSRLVISYYIHTKEYLVASEKSRTAVRLLANLSRTTSVQLPVFKRFLLLSLATIYTYYEAPKNFGRALELYDKVEQDDPDNVTVKIGRGFILIEKGDITTAKELLREASRVTRDTDAELELAWCQIISDEVQEGRSSLEHILQQFNDVVDVNGLEKRAKIMWRIAQSYIIEAKTGSNLDAEASDLVKKAYEYLISSLKQSKTYAPSYTSLGLIYRDTYHDEAKAIKCFFKSFELDNSDLVAARALVSHYSESQEWQICEVLCLRLLANENAKRALTMASVEDNSWPYRVMGICYLETQQFAKSVEFLQNAIRLNKSDQVAWSCLGEAYLACGRLEAALKVHEHCLKLVDTSSALSKKLNWYHYYMLALVNSNLGNFAEATLILEDLSESNVNEIAVSKLYCQNLASQAELYMNNGFIGRAVDAATKSIRTVYSNKDNQEFMTSQLTWKYLCDSLLILLYSQGSLDSLDSVVENVEQIVEKSLSNDFLVSLEPVVFEESDGVVATLVRQLIKSASNAIEAIPTRSSRDLRASLFHNLGSCFLQAYKLCHTDSLVVLQNAVLSFRKAIQLQDREPHYWTGLGVAAMLQKEHALAQHALIKSLALSPKDTLIWSILAIFYMEQNDLDLARETFARVQSLAPESNSGWLGTAMISEASGDLVNAWKYFTHGYVLSNGRSAAAQLLYAYSIVQKSVGALDDKRDLNVVEELTVANFAISNFLKKFPHDVLALNLALIVVERLGHYSKGVEVAEQLCTILETLYEKSEDEKILLGFARAKATLARLYLGDGNFSGAMEAARYTLDVAEDSIDSSDPEQVKLVLSARVVIGLCMFFTNDFEGSLGQLKLILAHEQQNSNSTETLFILISQILYANGTEESVQAAVDELFAYVEEAGTSLMVALTLGAISIVQNMEELLPAVKSDLLSLKLDELIEDNFRLVPLFIREINKRLSSKGENYDQRIAFMFPNDTRVWQHLNNHTSLSIASNSGGVSSDILADNLIQDGKLRLIQRGLFLDPSNSEGQQALQLCLE